jgi:hypothetical protein
VFVDNVSTFNASFFARKINEITSKAIFVSMDNVQHLLPQGAAKGQLPALISQRCQLMTFSAYQPKMAIDDFQRLFRPIQRTIPTE